MRTREQRQTDRVDIFLQSRLGNLLGGLVQAGVDDLEPMVAQSTSDGLGPTVMTIEARLGNDDSVRALHKCLTLRREAFQPRNDHNGEVAGFRLRSPLARAVAPVLAGIAFIVVLFLGTWGVAAFISDRGENITNLGSSIFEVGQVERIAKIVADDGPLLFPDLKSSAGVRSIVLDHTGDDATKGWQVYYGFPAGRDPSCLVEHVKSTRTFADCDGNVIDVEKLALPPDVRPVVENRVRLYIDLRG